MLFAFSVNSKSINDENDTLLVSVNVTYSDFIYLTAFSSFLIADEYRKIFLVIVHSVPRKELPGDSSNTRLMRLDKFKEIAEIVDMAFTKNKVYTNVS